MRHEDGIYGLRLESNYGHLALGSALVQELQHLKRWSVVQNRFNTATHFVS